MRRREVTRGATQQRRRRGSALALVAVLVLAACGDGDGDPETLEGFLGFDGDQEAMMAQAEMQQREIEEEIAACMADEGFEYEPVDLGSMLPQEGPRQELSEEEFREEYGYGITTIDRDQQSAADADPNAVMLEGMDDAERDAYHQALEGDVPEFDPDGDPQEQVFEPGGCRGQALESVQGEQMEVAQELQPAFAELFEQIEADPRMVEAEQDWQACMREAGFEYEDRFGPQQDLGDRLQELESAAYEMMDIEELGELEEGEEAPEPPPIDEEALAELRDEELEVASVEGACTSEHLDGVEAEVRADHEGGFIDEHRELLEPLRLDQDG